ARIRNPAIVVYAAPWTFPNWLGLENGTESEFYSDDALDYIVSWLQCAQETGAGTVEYVGNRPRPSSTDLLGQRQAHSLPPWRWVVALREALDDAGFNETRLVLPDSEYDATVEALWSKEPAFASAMADGVM
ncbi:galc, partial [Symbiodinium pilosum]